jgi:hypothetical protein
MTSRVHSHQLIPTLIEHAPAKIVSSSTDIQSSDTASARGRAGNNGSTHSAGASSSSTSDMRDDASATLDTIDATQRLAGCEGTRGRAGRAHQPPSVPDTAATGGVPRPATGHRSSLSTTARPVIHVVGRCYTVAGQGFELWKASAEVSAAGWLLTWCRQAPGHDPVPMYGCRATVANRCGWEVVGDGH